MGKWLHVKEGNPRTKEKRENGGKRLDDVSLALKFTLDLLDLGGPPASIALGFIGTHNPSPTPNMARCNPLGGIIRSIFLRI